MVLVALAGKELREQVHYELETEERTLKEREST
jgi:hypothetical protein